MLSLSKAVSRKLSTIGLIRSFPLANKALRDVYGQGARECPSPSEKLTFIFSQTKSFDLYELEQLLESVGWSRRPVRRVSKALDNSLLKVGLWCHDTRFPKLVGFARCTGDGVLEATIWDVAIHPIYQGSGLGKQLMAYVLELLRDMELERVTLFADPGVVAFYESQGWTLEPNQHRCAFWYAN